MSTIVLFILDDIDDDNDYNSHIKIPEHLIMEDTFMYLIDIDTLHACVSRNIVGTGLGISRNSAGWVIYMGPSLIRVLFLNVCAQRFRQIHAVADSRLSLRAVSWHYS